MLGNTNWKVDLSMRSKICLPYSIKIKMMRCLKDKIEAGVYVVSCEIIDWLGGTPYNYSSEKHYKSLEKFRKRVKRYEALKQEFLWDEWIADLERENSSEHLVDESEEMKNDSDLEEEELNKKYNHLNFKTQHTPYREFLGRYDDDEFYLDQDLHIFFPPIKS